MAKQGHDQTASNPQETRMSTALKKGSPVLEGNLLKKNKWFMKQERRFKLFATGEIIYYKDQEKKGSMMLCKDSKALKLNRTEVEVTLNSNHKRYILI